MRSFCVYGSAGELVVGRMSGRVLWYADYGDGEYADIIFFNADDWRRTYPGRMLDHVDILDPGYWTEGGAYAPPEYTWRACAREDGG